MMKLIIISLLSFLFTVEIATAASFRFGGIKMDVATQSTAAGTTTLTASSSQIQEFSGSSAQTVKLPSASTLANGYFYTVTNEGSGTVTVQNNGGATLKALTASTSATYVLTATTSAAGVWAVVPGAGSSGGGGSGLGAVGVFVAAFRNASSSVGWDNSQTGIADFTAHGTPAITNAYTYGFTAPTAAASNLPGVTFTAPVGCTNFYVTATTMATTTSSNNLYMQLTDGSNVVLDGKYLYGTVVTGISYPFTFTGGMAVTAGNSYTVKLRGFVSGSAVDIGFLTNAVTDVLTFMGVCI